MLQDTIAELISPTIKDLGFELVKLNLRNSNSIIVLEIMAEPSNGSHLSIGDCKLISYNVSALLDVEDIIKGKYYLEVSSPGIERPLIKLADYIRFINSMVRIRLKSLLNETSHYKGIITQVIEGEDNFICLQTDKEQEVKIPLELIKSAHLVVSDEMFRKIMKK